MKNYSENLRGDLSEDIQDGFINYSRKDPQRYDDMLLMPHHVSQKHLSMPLMQRAAQFLPYRSLSGFEEKIEETAKRYLSHIPQ